MHNNSLITALLRYSFFRSLRSAAKGDYMCPTRSCQDRFIGFGRGLGRKTVVNDGAKIIEKFADLGWQRVKIPAGMTVDQAIQQYQKLRRRGRGPAEFLLSPAVDAERSAVTSTGMYGLTKISAPQAWDLTTGSSTVVVANIDTGMRYTTRIWRQTSGQIRARSRRTVWMTTTTDLSTTFTAGISFSTTRTRSMTRAVMERIRRERSARSETTA